MSVFLTFITNEVKKKSVNLCIEDLSSLIEVCWTKWPSVKIVISADVF